MRRRWDSNPRSQKAHAFQACGIDRYPTPPVSMNYTNQPLNTKLKQFVL